MRLPATWWQRLADYAWHIHNLYPVQRKVASGETPIEELSGGNVTRTTVERRIEYATPPGTLCMVAEPGKHGGAFDASNCRLGLVKRMDDDVAVFVGTSRPSRRRFGVVSFLTRVVSGLAHSRVTFSIINSKCQVYTVNAQSICLPRAIRPIPIGELY